MTTETRAEWRILMADAGLTMCAVKLVMWIGIGITFGLAYPWLMNWYCGQWAERLIIGGRRVRYTGTPGGILAMWLKTWFFSLITLSVYWWIRGRRNIWRYLDSHLDWASA